MTAAGYEGGEGTLLREHGGLTLHLELLRFKRMLDWIVYKIVALLHDRAAPCVVCSRQTKLPATV